MDTNDFAIIKEKEAYRLYNNTIQPLYAIIKIIDCEGNEQDVVNYNINGNDNVLFTPEKDGDYVITGTPVNSPTRVIYLSHYYLLQTTFIKSVEALLCNCTTQKNCKTLQESSCIDAQNTVINALFTLGFQKTLNPSKDNTNALFEAYMLYFYRHHCSLMPLFCTKEVDIKLKNYSTYNNAIVKKMIAIMYLVLYFYEKEISNPQLEYIEYINTKFNTLTINDCILKTGIDITIVDNIFSEVYYKDYESPVICDLFTFISLTPYFELDFNFKLNEVINGVYHTIRLKNNTSKVQSFFNHLMYKDNDFKITAIAITDCNVKEVQPGEEFDVNLVFSGKKTILSFISPSYVLDGSVIGKYNITFADSVGTINTPPVITDFVKTSGNRTPITFTPADFDAHFTDADGHILGAIALTGNVNGFTFNDVPYQSNLKITRDNINKLVYTPINSDTAYSVAIEWIAFDELGLQNQ